MKSKTILLAADHAGYELKNKLVAHLKAGGHVVEDMGAPELDADDDYPEIMVPVGIRIAENPEKYHAIILGASGQGEAIVANRFPSVRAAVFYGGDLSIIRLSREHNDANVLSLGARFLTDAQATEAVDLWLATPFSGEERHARRIEEIETIS